MKRLMLVVLTALASAALFAGRHIACEHGRASTYFPKRSSFRPSPLSKSS